MCMTLSGHTSTLPRLVVQGHGFKASYLRWAQVKYVPQMGCFLTKAMTLSCNHNDIVIGTPVWFTEFQLITSPAGSDGMSEFQLTCHDHRETLGGPRSRSWEAGEGRLSREGRVDDWRGRPR